MEEEKNTQTQSIVKESDSDWVIMVDKDQEPDFMYNPYLQPNIFPKIDSLKQTVDIAQLKSQLIKRFEHFYHQFTQNMNILALQKQDELWQCNTQKFIQIEISKIENAAQQINFTNLLILKYYLVNVITYIKLNFTEKKEETIKEFTKFIDDNFIDLWACSQSEEYEILDIIIGKQNLHDKKQKFLLKSLEFCQDKYLEEEFQNASQAQGYQDESESKCEVSMHNFQFQKCKIEIFIHLKQYVEAFIYLKEIQRMYEKSYSTKQINKVIKLAIRIQALIMAEEKDPVQILLYNVLSDKIRTNDQFTSEIKKLKLKSEQEENQLKLWIIVAIQMIDPQADKTFEPLRLYKQKKDLFISTIQQNPQLNTQQNQETTVKQEQHSQQQSQQQKEEVINDDLEFDLLFTKSGWVKFKQSNKILALTLDGGGMRGVIQLILLAELEARIGKKCSEIFNFFSGTSIGAIIAMNLAKGVSAEHLLYTFLGRTRNVIFSRRHYLRYILGLRRDGDPGNSLIHPLYNQEGVEEELQNLFGDIKLSEMPTNILIAACNIDQENLKPNIFVKFKQATIGRMEVNGLRPSKVVDESFKDITIRQLTRASSAAYPYFSSTEINGLNFIDGGYLFNNTDILVINFLLSQRVELSEIKMLSLGNSPMNTDISSYNLINATTMLMGITNSIKNILNPEAYYQQYFTIAKINFQNSINESKELLKESYLRLEPDYAGKFIPLDSTSSEEIQQLKLIGQNWVKLLQNNGQMNFIIEKIIQRTEKEKDSIAVPPRYYSYQSLYKPIEQNYNSDLWKKCLIEFQFPKDESHIIEPSNVIENFKQIFTKRQDSLFLLSKAAAIGHIPTIKKILSGLQTREEKIKMIQSKVINNWTSLHYAAANGEISAFIYLVSELLDTNILFPKNQEELTVPQRVKRAIDEMSWNFVKESIKELLEDKDQKYLPYSNKYAPFFNFTKTNTLKLAEENNQVTFPTIMKYLVAD